MLLFIIFVLKADTLLLCSCFLIKKSSTIGPTVGSYSDPTHASMTHIMTLMIIYIYIDFFVSSSLVFSFFFVVVVVSFTLGNDERKDAPLTSVSPPVSPPFVSLLLFLFLDKTAKTQKTQKETEPSLSLTFSRWIATSGCNFLYTQFFVHMSKGGGFSPGSFVLILVLVFWFDLV